MSLPPSLGGGKGGSVSSNGGLRNFSSILLQPFAR
jgi:hypothetical protein